MKVGTENKKELMALLVLMAIAIPLLLYMFRDQLFGSASAANVPAPPVSASKRGPVTAPHDNDYPGLRKDILEASRKVQYEAGRNIFHMEQPTIEAMKAPARPSEMGPPAPPTPTPTPPPPPIPITYYGFANQTRDSRKIFLQKTGDDTPIVASQGDIVARRYRVVQIQPTSVTMEDVITGNRQTIRLTPREQPH